MILTRTPFRISFAGGGTDISIFYKKNKFGRVLSSTIDKYLYVMVKKLPSFVEHKYRINWSQTEFVNSINKIKNPIAREALKYFKIDFPIEITTISEIPAQTGLGSSSAFAVGLVNALFALKGKRVSKETIARTAAHIEIKMLKRFIGKQDHYASAYGGVNVFTFYKNEKVLVKPLKKINYNNLINNISLFFTFKQRDTHAGSILQKQKLNSDANINELKNLLKDVDLCEKIMTKKKNLDGLGKILDRSWKFKLKNLKSKNMKQLNFVYKKAIKNGAKGGKILGAGNGGFFLFHTNNKVKDKLKNNLTNNFYLDFNIENEGTKIILDIDKINGKIKR